MTSFAVNSRLQGLKLRAVVAEHRQRHAPDSPAPSEVGDPVDIGIGAALCAGDEAWVLVEERPERAIGIGLAWMHRAAATSLRLVSNRDSGVVARRARNFMVDIEVWGLDGRDLVAVPALEHHAEIEPVPSHLELGSLIFDSGADVVIEHGVVSGEVRGLEVCRVVDDPQTGSARLEVGVGAHDREAFALMHADTPIGESLKRVVDVVRRHRQPGADPHPLNRLAAERSLRSRILEEPDIIDARHLRPVSSTSARTNVKDAVPCAAVGETRGGRPLVAVFSTGIDLDVVPVAADIRTWHSTPEAELVIVVPVRDSSPVTHRLASMLHRPATVVGVEQH